MLFAPQKINIGYLISRFFLSLWSYIHQMQYNFLRESLLEKLCVLFQLLLKYFKIQKWGNKEQYKQNFISWGNIETFSVYMNLLYITVFYYILSWLTSILITIILDVFVFLDYECGWWIVEGNHGNLFDLESHKI